MEMNRSLRNTKYFLLLSGDDEYPNMICVKSGNVTSGVTLMPGLAFEASQILQVM